ncbi:ABC transporter permease [Neorhizobium sp. P12A]|nr:ABC transporter permease [Neorhizobium sp. P12A]
MVRRRRRNVAQGAGIAVYHAGPGLDRLQCPFRPIQHHRRTGPAPRHNRSREGLDAVAGLFRHILRNALLPILTIVGIQVGQLLSGTVIIETVFSRPGIGRLLVQSILAKDYLTVQAVVLIIAIIYALTNFIVDLLYPVLDPRIANR